MTLLNQVNAELDRARMRYSAASTLEEMDASLTEYNQLMDRKDAILRRMHIYEKLRTEAKRKNPVPANE